VKESSNLESTYYILKHAINDPKISQTFFIPIGLAAIIYAFFLLIQYPSGAIIGILVAVGFYMLYRGLNLDETFVVFKEKAKQSIYTGQITFITYLMAVLIAIIATIRGAVELWGYYTTGGSWYYGFVTLMTAFVNVTVWWYVSSVLFAYAGKIIEIKMDNKFNKRKLSPVFFTISVGLLLWGASKYILAISSLATESTTEFILPYFIYTVVSAIILGFAGIYIATTHVEKKRDEP
jgi:putative membrane protein